MLGKHINHCEDSLTAAVFTHLLHLPTELFWRILRNACYTKRLPRNAGEVLDSAFWPQWNAVGTDNLSRVVPDLFIRFAEFDLIIEAKRWDDGMQDPAQWQRELVAYSNEHGHEGIPVKMIALGGLHTQRDDEITCPWPLSDSRSSDPAIQSKQVICPVHMCRWRGLLDQCKRMHRELSSIAYSSSQIQAHIRILFDTIDLFGCHGFSTGLWFADFDFSAHRLSGQTNRHLDLLQQRSLQLQCV